MSLVSTAVVIAGRYRLDRQLASDNTAEVWQGADLELARPVAVKLLRADAGDADSVGQFRVAARRAGAVVHENLLRVFDYCEPGPSSSPQCPFLVMEYVDGQLLAELLDGGPLGPRGTIDVVAQVAAALQVLHQAGLAHGDVRPGKILLKGDGAPRLFGFSGAGPTGPTAIGGDLHALGVLAQRCLTGCTSTDDLEALGDQIPVSVTQLVAELWAQESAAEPDATAGIARRAAAMRAQLGDSALAVRIPALSVSVPEPPATPSAVSPASTQVFARALAGPPAVSFWQATAASAGHTSAKRGNVVALRTSAVIVIALAAFAVFGALKPHNSTPEARAGIRPASIRVNAAKLIGQPVNVVRIRLQRLGLVVRVRWRDSASVSAGEVVAVRPAGLVPLHSIIVLVGSSGRSSKNGAVSRVPTALHSHRPAHLHRFPAHGPSAHPPSGTPSPLTSSSPTPSASPSPSPSGSPLPSSSPPTSSSPPPSASAINH